MKKGSFLFVLLLSGLLICAQSDNHFFKQKMVLIKYRITHNEKYFDQFIKNWEKEIPAIPDSVITKWSLFTINSFQIIQTIFDSSRYVNNIKPCSTLKILGEDYFFINDTSCIILPEVLRVEVEQKKNSSLLKDTNNYLLNWNIGLTNQYDLKHIKPLIYGKKTLNLTSKYKKFLSKNLYVLKKINHFDFEYISKGEQLKKKFSKRHSKIDSKSIEEFIVYTHIEEYKGSIPVCITIVFDKTFTFAKVRNIYDGTSLICKKMNSEWFVIEKEGRYRSIFSDFTF